MHQAERGGGGAICGYLCSQNVVCVSDVITHTKGTENVEEDHAVASQLPLSSLNLQSSGESQQTGL